MADYHSPTIVSPPLPLADISPLEHLVLGQLFDAELADRGLIYFHSWSGPREFLSVEAGELREAHAASTGIAGVANDLATVLLDRQAEAADAGQDDDIEIDLSIAGSGWERMLQDVLRRSSEIDEIVVTTSFTCTKMRPDGFGGLITRITAKAIESCSTVEMLERMREQDTSPGIDDPQSFESHHRLQAMAEAAGWNSFTLLLLIANWLDANGHTGGLIDHLDRLVDPGSD
jgi:hypothetical protein